MIGASPSLSIVNAIAYIKKQPLCQYLKGKCPRSKCTYILHQRLSRKCPVSIAEYVIQMGIDGDSPYPA